MASSRLDSDTNTMGETWEDIYPKTKNKKRNKKSGSISISGLNTYNMLTISQGMLDASSHLHPQTNQPKLTATNQINIWRLPISCNMSDRYPCLLSMMSGVRFPVMCMK